MYESNLRFDYIRTETNYITNAPQHIGSLAARIQTEMKKIILIAFLYFLTNTSLKAQTANENIVEGKLLYRWELASELSIAHLKSNHKSIYKSEFAELSYSSNNQQVETIIYSNKGDQRILARYKYDSIPKPSNLSVELSNLAITQLEAKLITLKTDASSKVSSHFKGNFKDIPSMTYRIIPIIVDSNNKVVVYPRALKKTSELYFGNDYAINYDSLLQYKSITKLHQKTSKVPFSSSRGMLTVHEHQTEDEITSTDVCALLSNKENIQWKQHIVLNPMYVAIFDIKEVYHILMMREEFDAQMKKRR